MKVIILCGTMGSGKDTVASILAQHGYVPMALADELKRLAIHLFIEDIDPESCFGPSHLREHKFRMTERKIDEAVTRFCESAYVRDIGSLCLAPLGRMLSLFREVMSPKIGEEVTVRWALQHLGTEWGRTLHKNLWVNLLRRNVSKLELFADARYTREDGVSARLVASTRSWSPMPGSPTS